MTIDENARIHLMVDGEEEKVGECHEANGVWYFQAEEDLFLSRDELMEVAKLMEGL